MDDTLHDENRFEVVDDTDAGRFLLRRNGETVGFATYRLAGDTVVVPHVETLAVHRGQGYGARLVDGMLGIIRADGHRVVPLCPFAADHIRANPEHHDLVR